MKCRVLIVCALMITLMVGKAAEYHVATTGNDSNPGSSASPWRTIQRAANVMQAGDTVYVRPGTYNERVTPAASGTAAGYINYVGGTNVVCRGFTVNSRNYLRIIGFEITHVDTRFTRAVTLAGTCSRIEILNNYIHHVYCDGGAIGDWGSRLSYITVRGNYLYYMGYVPGVDQSGNGWAIESGYTGDHWLIEYNVAERCGDFVNVHGQNQIIRNNWLHSYDDSYFSGGGGHVDIFQPGSAGVMTWTRHHVYEANVAGDNVEDHSHYWQMRDTASNSTDTNILCRGNVGYNMGAYILQAGGLDHVVHYNNTFYAFGVGNLFGESMMRYNAESGNVSLYNQNFNNVFSSISTAKNFVLISTDGGATVTASHNLGYNTPGHSSLILTSNPMLANPSGRQFYLQSSSPAINRGKPISTVTSSDGTGTTFSVPDAALFCDGWGIAEGDIIRVGSGSPVRITRIAGNAITVDRTISWSNGMGVFWRHQDSQPDLGAYEYRADSYGINIALTSPQNGGTVGGSTTLTASVTNPDCVRFVIFYVNGVPVAQTYNAPYTATWNAPTTGTFDVEARAYPLYADTNLVRIARINVRGSGEARPQAPSNLRVTQN